MTYKEVRRLLENYPLPYLVGHQHTHDDGTNQVAPKSETPLVLVRARSKRIHELIHNFEKSHRPNDVVGAEHLAEIVNRQSNDNGGEDRSAFSDGSARHPELFWPFGVRRSRDGYARHPKLRMAVDAQKSVVL